MWKFQRRLFLLLCVGELLVRIFLYYQRMDPFVCVVIAIAVVKLVNTVLSNVKLSNTKECEQSYYLDTNLNDSLYVFAFSHSVHGIM